MAEIRKDVEIPFDVHDQLPAVEEIKLEAGLPRKSTCSTIKQAILIALGVVILVLSLFFLTVTMAATKDDLTEDDGGHSLENSNANEVVFPEGAATGPTPTVPTPTVEGSTPDPITATPVPTPDPSLQRVVEILKSVSDYDELITPSTFQNLAASWIANDHLGDYYLNNGHHDELKERYILAVFFYAMNGEKWEHDLNFLSTKDVCHWFGSKTFAGTWCDESGRVVQLMFPENYLVGIPPAELQHLRELKIVDFGNNPGIQGEFPTFLEKLTKLTYLGLQYCGLKGSIPEWVASKTTLRTLVLSNNHFSGSLPPTNQLTNMEYLYLDDNSLKGDISEFSAMTMLKHLVIEDNDFKGRLDAIMKLSNLETLDISHNQIGSTLPSNIWEDLTNLKVLDIHGNSFTGNLPPAERANIPTHLEFLAVNDNSFGGEIPVTLKRFSSLRHLDLSNNAFDSTLPESLEGLTNLRYLFVAHNALQGGEIPTFLTSMTNLVDLSLQNTNRVGTIPDWISGSSFPSLTMLDLGNNALEGPIPDTIGSMISLRHLLLNRNNLHGSIPSKLRTLSTLLLDHNGRLDSLTEQVCSSSSSDAVATSSTPNVFTADCGGNQPQVSCECCTLCCAANDASCNSVTWNGEVDGIWEYFYRRNPGTEGYQFSKEEP